MPNLFVYGTLLSKDVCMRIVGKEHSSDSAFVKGYARKKVKRKNYPGLVEQSGSVVEGKIYYDVSDDDFTKLDAYEGDEYDRTMVYAQLFSGICVKCFMYLYKKEMVDMLTNHDWTITGLGL